MSRRPSTAGAARPTRPRLLYVGNNPAFFESYRGTVASAALAAGYDVHVATPDGPAVAAIVRRGLTHHVLPLDRRSVNPVREAGTVRALRRLYTRLAPDVIEQMTIKPVIYGSLAARRICPGAVINWMAGLGVLFADRGRRSRLLQPAIVAAYRAAMRLHGSTVVFENPDHRRTFVEAGAVPAARAIVIEGAGVPMDLFVPRPVPPGPPIVMLAGRMLWDKGVRDFVDAARRLREAGTTARFVLVGAPDPGNPASIPRRQLEAWNAEGLVEWWGESTCMPEVYPQATVFCFPTVYAEGVPRVLIEAAACARPLVTTDTPGCREVVRDGENGRLVPPRSPERVAAAIAELLNDPVRCAAWGARGRQLVEDRFSVDTIIGQTLALYAAVASRRALPRTEAPQDELAGSGLSATGADV